MVRIRTTAYSLAVMGKRAYRKAIPETKWQMAESKNVTTKTAVQACVTQGFAVFVDLVVEMLLRIRERCCRPWSNTASTPSTRSTSRCPTQLESTP